MSGSLLGDVRAYWEKLRSGRVAPYRSELDPRAFVAALENAFILERVAPGNIRFRLAGAALCDLLGMDLRGMPAAALCAPDHRKEFDAALARVVDRPEIVALGLTSAEAGRTTISGDMLLLPLRNDFGTVNRVLGAFTYTPATAIIAPRRFAITSRKFARIVATAEADSPLSAFAEDAADFEPAPGLRAVAGGRDPAAPRRAHKAPLRVIPKPED